MSAEHATNRRTPVMRSHAPLLLLVISLPVVAHLLWQFSDAGLFTFERPWALLLLLALPLCYWLLFAQGSRRRAHLIFSSTAVLGRLKPGVGARLSAFPGALRLVAVTLLIVGLARPQTRDRAGHVEVEGIDIMVALDLSQSMEADDLRPNRLEAAKKVLDDFIQRRRSDRIGLVLFGKEAFTHCPLTLDYSVLRNLLADTRLGLIDGQATAIGNALALSLARLRKSDAKSRVVILLTDGQSNAGNVMPKEAARYARAMGVKVFTILMGPSGKTLRHDMFGRRIRSYPVNPKLLQQIAAQTGGKAFLATDRRALEQNFEQILDELDKSTRRDVAAPFKDAYLPFAALALALLGFEWWLRLTRYREFP